MLRSSYSLFHSFKLSLWWFRSKFICWKVRLIRFPIDLRGKNKIDFGCNLTTGVGCRLEVFSSDNIKRLIIGTNVQINDYVHISVMKKVKIGNNVLMASHIYVSDNSHGLYKGEKEHTSPLLAPIERPYYIAPVIIEDNVWIAEGVVIMPGVVIGKGCIIGANAVVTKSIPSYSMAVGQPAKVIKVYNFALNRWVIQ